MCAVGSASGFKIIIEDRDELGLDELQKHSWVAKRRRMNWEESHTLGLLTNEVIQEILKLHGRGSQTAGTSALSPEEQAFFKYFEDEMGTLGSRTPAP